MKKIIKKILITGNLGYVGTVLTDLLCSDYKIIGLDIGYFKNCLVQKIKKKILLNKFIKILI